MMTRFAARGFRASRLVSVRDLCLQRGGGAGDRYAGRHVGQRRAGGRGGAGCGAEPKTVADVFPPGRAREAVLNNCATCHNLACSAIGQRTAARWHSLKAAHKDKVPERDVDAMFAYLKAQLQRIANLSQRSRRSFSRADARRSEASVASQGSAVAVARWRRCSRAGC